MVSVLGAVPFWACAKAPLPRATKTNKDETPCQTFTTTPFRLFAISDHISSHDHGPPLLPAGYGGGSQNRTPTLDHTDENDHNRQDQQNVDEPRDRVACHQS